MTHQINFTVLDLNLFIWIHLWRRRCSVSLCITHPCNDIYWSM